MSQNRVDEIKKGLDSDVYKKINELDQLKDETLASTEKLANILDGYVTKMENFAVSDETGEFEVLNEAEIEMEVDDKDILKEYNEQIHDFGLETLTELLSKGSIEEEVKEKQSLNLETFNGEAVNDEVDEIIEKINDFKNPNDQVSVEETKESFTKSLVTPNDEQIDFDDTVVPDSEQKVKKSKKKEKKAKKQKPKKQKIKEETKLIDKILLLIIIILFIAFLVLSIRIFNLGA